MHAVHGRVLPNFFFFLPKLFMALCHEWHVHKLNACCPWQSAAQFFIFLPKLFMALCHEWHADKLNACCPWQSAAQFFFFLPKLFMALCHERHADKLNASRPWQSAAQFFFILPKLFMALCHERHANKLNACHPWQSAAQFFFFFSNFTWHLYKALQKRAFIQTKLTIYTMGSSDSVCHLKKKLAFIQNLNCWHLYKNCSGIYTNGQFG